MHTKLDIDEDVLIAVKELARRESKSMSTLVSSLLRASLESAKAPDPADSREELEAEFGFRPFPRRGGVVTNASINRLR